MTSWFRKLSGYLTSSIKKKFIVIGLCFSLVPMLIVGTFILYYTSGHLTELTYTRFQSNVEQVHRNVTEFLDTKAKEVRTWSEMQTLQETLHMRFGWQDSSELLRSLVQRSDGLAVSMLLNQDGTARSASHEFILGRNFEGQEWFKKMNSQESGFLFTRWNQFPFLDETDHPSQTVLVGQTLRRADGRLLGYLVNVVDWNHVENIVVQGGDQRSEGMYQSEYGYKLQAMLDGDESSSEIEDYMITAHPSQRGKRISEVLPRGPFQHLKQRLKQINPGGIKRIHYELNNQPKTVIAIAGGEVVEGASPRWYYLVGANDGEIFVTVNFVQYVIAGSVLLIALVVSLLVYYLSSRISDRISTVTTGIERIAAGELDQDPIEVTGNDEFSSLGESYNRMLAELNQVARQAQAIVEEDFSDSVLDTDVPGDLGQAVDSMVEAAEETVRTREELKEASEAKSRFLAQMSHEIRTPLNAIMGVADILEETDLDQEQRHYVDVFQNSSEILLNLINDVLDLSKIEAGELELNEDFHDIDAMMVKTVEFFAQKAHEKDLELNVFVDPDCPPAVKVDRERIRQILVNLIGNALKFTEDGEVNVRLEVDEYRGDEVRVQFEVEDTGVGISEDQQRRIFEEFGQTQGPSKADEKGTGLGLNICQHLVAKMDGELQLDSVPEEGSRFYFTLQVSYQDEPVDSDRPSPGDPAELKGARVLIVDDNATNRTIFRKYLELIEVDVETAADGTEALEYIEKTDFDAVLLDKRMPGPDGFDVVEQLPDQYQTQSVVMLTSDDLAENRNQVSSHSLGGYFVKPISRMKLVSILTDVLSEGSDADTSMEPEAPASDYSDLTGEILLAEDNENNRLVVSSYLDDTKINLEEVVNGEQALEQMKKRQFDLILMDLNMPEMDGMEATKQYRDWEQRNRSSQQNVVALTADALEGTRDKADEAGFDDYLTKPVSKEDLIELISQYC